MAKKELNMKHIKEVLRLKFELGLSNRDIAISLSMSSSSVSKYTHLFEKSKLAWPLPADLGDTQIHDLLFKDQMSTKLGTPVVTAKHTPIDCNYIHKELKRKSVTLNLLWEEYTQNNVNNAYSRSQYCAIYKQWSKLRNVSMRQQHKAGDKLFIDYSGQTVPIIDKNTGEIRKAEIFLAVLGASSYIFAEATWTQGLTDWISSHVRAFEYFDGVPSLLVPDNLRSGIKKPCRYEPEENASYAELARHYGTTILPARPKKPKDKAKAEESVQHVERRILARLRNTTFFSLYELNEQIRKILKEVNDAPFQKIPDQTRSSLFLEVDKPALKPLPIHKFEFIEFKNTKVHIDYHVEAKGHYYSVPYILVGKIVELKITATIIEILFDGKTVANHMRNYKRGAHTTLDEHMPEKHKQQSGWTESRFIKWANTIGQETVKTVEKIIAKKQHPEQSYRACLGLLSLAKKYSAQRLEAACTLANKVGSYNRHTVVTILQNGTDQLPQEPDDVTSTITHENIRGPEYFE
jgi:transposase